ncbi:hypothetical protein PYCCODRAFT_649962 [Trametes coccinea BRFM310]|uniref:Uncharacterized protein n=1 Tax=Trametes coccinea (strain BRFM310) TaxID=1353009 RepID=A0A1Y2III0_TRAC3|nr:hypothetical protein PYCCODRAFT_649962 [Trametes coccinea BRFM310]
MVFSNSASGNDKDQLRSTARTRMQSRLQTVLMPVNTVSSSASPPCHRSLVSSRREPSTDTIALVLQRRHIQSSSVIIPSTPQSECSTLVDFAIEDVLIKDEDEDEEEVIQTDEYMLDSDNSAWARGNHTPAKASKNRVRVRVQYASGPVSQDELLSADNSAWVAGRPCASQPKPKTRSWFAAAGRHDQAITGCEPEMLDPEDRAWM